MEQASAPAREEKPVRDLENMGGSPSSGSSAPRLGQSPDAGGDVLQVQGSATYLARLLVLGAVLVAGILLNHLSAGQPYFIYLTVGGVLLVAVNILLGQFTSRFTMHLVLPVFDLAWVTLAMYFTNGLQSFLLPLLYVIVATAAIRGERWEMGTTVAGGITAIFVLAALNATDTNTSFAAAQAVLLMAGALALRMFVASTHEDDGALAGTREMYDELMETTSDAVLTLDPETWRIQAANPVAQQLFAGDEKTPIVGQSLGEIIRFSDTTFMQAARTRLEQDAFVRDAVTYGHCRNGEEVVLRISLTPGNLPGQGAILQAVFQVEELNAAIEARGRPLLQDDFITHYIPSLTHELNNHLASIRLASELAAATAQPPDYEEIVVMVDHCQEVLQTIVLQMLRAATPQINPLEVPYSDLRQVVEQALLLMRPQVLASNTEVQLKLPDEAPQVAGFAYELQEALVRIFAYSTQAMRERELPHLLAVGATVRQDDGVVELTISDCGPGLPMNHIALINGRQSVRRGNEDRVWQLVRESLCRFGGTVHATNGLNGGARFKIELPIEA